MLFELDPPRERPTWPNETPTAARQPQAEAARIPADAADGGNGNPRPALSVKTNDKGQVFSHIRQKWLSKRPKSACGKPMSSRSTTNTASTWTKWTKNCTLPAGDRPGAGRRGYLADGPRQGRQQGPADRGRVQGRQYHHQAGRLRPRRSLRPLLQRPVLRHPQQPRNALLADPQGPDAGAMSRKSRTSPMPTPATRKFKSLSRS